MMRRPKLADILRYKDDSQEAFYLVSKVYHGNRKYQPILMLMEMGSNYFFSVTPDGLDRRWTKVA